MFANRAIEPSINHAEATLQKAGRQLHYVTAHANFSGEQSVAYLLITPICLPHTQNSCEDYCTFKYNGSIGLGRKSRAEQSLDFVKHS